MTANNPLELIEEILGTEYSANDAQRIKELIEMAVESRIPGALDIMEDLSWEFPLVFDLDFCERMEERAFELGNDDALCYRFSDLRTDPRELFLKVQETADRYGGIAIEFLAIMYLNGMGTEHDSVKAMEYAMRAKENGMSSADTVIGILLLRGSEEVRDVERGISMLTDLAFDGDAEAAFELAHAYYYGEPVPKDIPKALDFAACSAQDGFLEAIDLCCDMIADGYDVGCDPVGMLEEVLKEGDSMAVPLLAKVYSWNPVFADMVKAAKYLRLGSDLGLEACLMELTYRIAADEIEEEYEGEFEDLVMFGAELGIPEFERITQMLEEERTMEDVHTDDRIGGARPGVGCPGRHTRFRRHVHG